MSRFVAALVAAFFAVAPVLGAQTGTAGTPRVWNDARTRQVVDRAMERRAVQLADTSLRAYRASAHGYLTFLGQLGDSAPPKIVKADELALEVYWKAPNRSKQRIVGRRDSLLLPTDIQYHRDHLGIVQNNFPDIIRLGEGDEVADVPHPLSAAGRDEYDFAIGDSLTMRLPDRDISVYEVRVRPRVDTLPRIVGAVYIDRETGEVVRMAFNFTRAAFLDKQLVDLAIVLENALVGNRYWLPRRQEIEIRRAATWLDFPVTGIIRGRWEIRGYDVNAEVPDALFAGPEIVSASRRQLDRYEWEGRILDSLPPDVRAVTDEDVRRVQGEARALVREQALARAQRPALAARRLSDFVRGNRVEGIAFGAGVSRQFGGGVTAALTGRWGAEDEEAKGRLEVAWRRGSGRGASLFAERSYRDARDAAESSLARNSVAALEFGSDWTQPHDVRAAGLALELGSLAGMRWRLEGARERHGALAIHASPATGEFEPTIPALRLDGWRASLLWDRPVAMAPLGLELALSGEARGLWFEPRDGGGRRSLARAWLSARAERPVGAGRLVLETMAGAVSARGDVPPQSLVYLGGPVTGPGYDSHAFVAELAASQRVEWRTPVPFFSIPLGRYGRAPGGATLAPFAHAAYVSRVSPLAGRGEAGWYPALGVGALLFFDVIRVDLARGLRDGRWTFSVDVARDFWRIL